MHSNMYLEGAVGEVWISWLLIDPWGGGGEKRRASVWVLIKINLVFFLFLANHLSPHLSPQILVLCKKSSRIWASQRRQPLSSL